MAERRILFFSLTYLPFVGGAELAVKEITDRIAPSDVAFDLVTLRFDRALPRVERAGNLSVYRVGFVLPPFFGTHPEERNGGSEPSFSISDTYAFPLSLNKTLFPLFALSKALRLHRQRRYNAVWAIMANQAGFAALLFHWLRPKIPFILTLQEGDPPEHILRRVGLLRPLFKQIFRGAAVVTAISNYLADFARAMGARGRVEVVPNGVDMRKFQYPPGRPRAAGQAMSNFQINSTCHMPHAELEHGPELSVTRCHTAHCESSDVGQRGVALRCALGLSKTDRVVITVSRLVYKNGVDTLIEAMRFLPENVKLLIAGTGPLLEKYQLLVASCQLPDRVRFLGYIDHADLPRYLALADVFCRPSRSEGMGSAFIEAMAAGVPIVATRIGGIPDFLQHEGTGLFAEVDNSKSIAAQIERILADRPLRERIVAEARAMVEQRYSWEGIARKMRACVAAAIERCCGMQHA